MPHDTTRTHNYMMHTKEHRIENTKTTMKNTREEESKRNQTDMVEKSVTVELWVQDALLEKTIPGPAGIAIFVLVSHDDHFFTRS